MKTELNVTEERKHEPKRTSLPPQMPEVSLNTEKIVHPIHYNTGKIEVIDFIQDQKLNFNRGNVVKYVARAAHKGKELEDLKKARFYLDYEIKQLEAPR